MRRLPRSAEPKCTEPGMGALGEGARGCMCKGTHTRACTHPCMHARTRAHTHTHPCMHAHTRVCTRTRPVLMLAVPVHAHRWGARTRARGKVGAHTCTLLASIGMCTHACACTPVQANIWCMHTHMHVVPCKHLVHALMHAHTRARTHTPVQASGACTLVHVHVFPCMHLHTHAHSRACTAPLHARSFPLTQPLHPAAAPRSVPAGRARPPVPPRRAEPLSFCLAAPFQGPRALKGAEVLTQTAVAGRCLRAGQVGGRWRPQPQGAGGGLGLLGAPGSCRCDCFGGGQGDCGDP